MKRQTLGRINVIAALTTCVLNLTASAQTVTLDWAVQTQINWLDFTSDVFADGSGNVFVSGTTWHDDGLFRNREGYLANYDTAGNLQWLQILPDPPLDTVSVSADKNGNVYVAGAIHDSLEGDGVYQHDTFLSKYDTSGALKWSRRLGDPDSDGWAQGVVADDFGNVYIIGAVEKSFLAKFNDAGQLQWTQQFEDEFPRGIAADSEGNIYITGDTISQRIPNAQNETDVFVSKYDPSGIAVWTRQTRITPYDHSFGISVDAIGNVYISGSSWGDFGATGGVADAFLMKYDESGERQWFTPLSTPDTDQSFDVTADNYGNVHVQISTTKSDASHISYITTFDADGKLLIAQTELRGGRIYADGTGNLYVAGSIERIPSGQNAYLAKYSISPAWIQGDFNANGVLDAADIDQLSAAVREGQHPASFDLNGDALVNADDREVWVRDLKHTYFGDADLDGEFSSGDLVTVFASDKYESGQVAVWKEGDWDGDGAFGSGDLVLAFQEGGYEQGPRAATSTVPEPSTLTPLLFGLIAVARRQKVDGLSPPITLDHPASST